MSNDIIVSSLASIAARLSAIESKLGLAAGGAAGGAEVEELAPQVVAFDAFIASNVTATVAAAKALGGTMATAAQVIEDAFAFDRLYIHRATKCKKPPTAKLRELMAPLSATVQKLVFDGRDPQINCLKAVADGVLVTQWVVAEPSPLDVIAGYQDGAEFWGNKVRTTQKGTPEAAFVDSFRDTIKALVAFVRATYKTGVSWNPHGTAVEEYKAPGAAPATAAAPAPVAAAAPTAPAAASGAAAGDSKDAEADAAAAKAAVWQQLSQIDQSSGKTAGLRHVTKEMKSDASRSAQPVAVPVAASSSAPKVNKPAATKATDAGFSVEYYVDQTVEITEATFKQQVYIFNCHGATVKVTGKVKNIIVDTCTRFNLLVDSVVSTVEFVNCKRVKAQVVNSVPTVSVDKTDGFLVYLARTSLETQIVTAKSSEINVAFKPSDDPEADWKELPVPEQFVSTVSAAGTLNTRVSDLYH